MAIELTREQQEQLERERLPASVRDPRSRRNYILLPAEQYQQMIDAIEDDTEQRALRQAAAHGLAGRAGESV